MKFAAEEKSYPINLDKPPVHLKLQSAEVTLPNLYGNGLYLLHMLMALKVIRLNDGEYLAFRALYNKPIEKWVVSDITELDALLGKALVVDDRKLRLQGLLANFGQQDWLTLKLLELLHREGQDYTVMLGPGEVEFISYCEQTLLQGDAFKRTIRSEQTTSLNHFIRLVNGYFIDKKAELWTLIDESLLSHIKIADTAITGETDNKITVFTTALVNKAIIDNISAANADKLRLGKEATLIQKINALNQLVQDKSRQRKLHTLFPNLFPSLQATRQSNPSDTPLSRLIWTGDIESSETDSSNQLTFVYDHPKKLPPAPHYHNLNSGLGYLQNTNGEIRLWHRYCITKGLITTVETETQLAKDDKKRSIFVVHEFKETNRFTVATPDQKPVRVPLPASISGAEAQRRVKHLYRHTSEHPSREQLLSIASSLFWAEYPEDKAPVCMVSPTPFKK